MFTPFASIGGHFWQRSELEEHTASNDCRKNQNQQPWCAAKLIENTLFKPCGLWVPVNCAYSGEFGVNHEFLLVRTSCLLGRSLSSLQHSMKSLRKCAGLWRNRSVQLATTATGLKRIAYGRHKDIREISIQRKLCGGRAVLLRNCMRSGCLKCCYYCLNLFFLNTIKLHFYNGP